MMSQGKLISKEISQLRPPGQNQTLKFRLIRLWDCRIPNSEMRAGVAFLAVDAQGDGIHVQIKERDCQLFSEKLSEGDIYEISKFQVARATARNLCVMRDYMIYFTPSTLLKKIRRETIPFPMRFFSLLDREKMLPYVNTDKYLTDVLGTLISIGPVTSVESSRFNKTVQKRDIFLRELGGEDLRVTIWESSFDKLNEGELLLMQSRPVLLITGVSFKIFKGIPYVASTSAMRVYVNLDIPETEEIRTVQEANNNEQVQELPLGDEQPTLQQRINQSETATLFQLLNFEAAEIGMTIYKCEVTVAALDTSHGWFYYACNVCNRSLNRAEDRFSCKEHNFQVPKLVMKLPMTVKDETAEMDVTAFDNHAEAMTDMKLSLLASKEELSHERVPEKITNILQKKFTVFLGLSPQAIRDAVLTYRVYRAIPIIEEVASLVNATNAKGKNPEGSNPAMAEEGDFRDYDGGKENEKIAGFEESQLSEKIDALLQQGDEEDDGIHTNSNSNDDEHRDIMEISPTKKQKRD